MINNRSITSFLIGWLTGITFSIIGLINVFWGNDTAFGVFLLILSLIFLPPINTLIKNLTGKSIPLVAKIILAVFIIWASMGVGELPDKIDMMLTNLK